MPPVPKDFSATQPPSHPAIATNIDPAPNDMLDSSPVTSSASLPSANNPPTILYLNLKPNMSTPRLPSSGRLEHSDDFDLACHTPPDRSIDALTPFHGRSYCVIPLADSLSNDKHCVNPGGSKFKPPGRCKDGEHADPGNADYLILECRSAIAPHVTVPGH